MHSARHVVRNVARRAGVEIVPARAKSNLLALHTSELFDRYRINCVIDVGARVGEYGLWLRANGYRGRIVSFEPIAANVVGLKAAALYDPQWFLHRMALGASPGEAEINVTNESQFSSFLSPNDLSAEMFAGDSAVARSETVPVARLDDVFDEAIAGIGDPHVYLKLDTQGYDLEVLKGATLSLARVAALQSEVSCLPVYEGMPDFTEAVAYIREQGFDVSGMFPVGLDQHLRALEFDCVAVRSPASAARGQVA
jgi:FkbM family methyltransferase